MKKYLYFQSATIAGDDTSEEAIMLPADRLTAIEPNDATTASMIFSGQGIGDEDGGTNNVVVQLAVTGAQFQEFCRQIAKFINADVLNRDNSAYSKDGMLVVANQTDTFHSSVTNCVSIYIGAVA